MLIISIKAEENNYQNQTSYENSLANNSYLPELINKPNESVTELIANANNQEESIKNLENISSRFETTAAFAPQRTGNFTSKAIELNKVGESNKNIASNLSASESNKIKEMIDKVDNK